MSDFINRNVAVGMLSYSKNAMQYINDDNTRRIVEQTMDLAISIIKENVPAVDVQAETLNSCEDIEAKLCEAKRLLRLAVDDFANIGEVNAAPTSMIHPKYGEYLKVIDFRTHKWRYTDEAEKLLGEEI